MSIVIQAAKMPALVRMSTKGSKYDFSTLVAGSGEAVLETEVGDVSKVQARLTSALSAYKKRTGDKGRFTVRPIVEAGVVVAVGVWKLADAAAVATATATASAE